MLSEDVVWAYLAQITLALYDCHSEVDSNGKRKPIILHRDIKPENGTSFARFPLSYQLTIDFRQSSSTRTIISNWGISD